MRLKYDYVSVMKNVFSSIVTRFKPLTVHTEAIMIDRVWEEIKKNALKNKVHKWYIMTPINYDYFKSSFNVKQSKIDLSKVMIRRYKWLLEHNQRLELHIHLSMIMDMSLKEQEKIFRAAINWIKKSLNIEVKEFVPGWWIYNKDTLKILKKHKLKLIKPSDYDYTHDYNWVFNKFRIK